MSGLEYRLRRVRHIGFTERLCLAADGRGAVARRIAEVGAPVRAGHHQRPGVELPENLDSLFLGVQVNLGVRNLDDHVSVYAA